VTPSASVSAASAKTEPGAASNGSVTITFLGQRQERNHDHDLGLDDALAAAEEVLERVTELQRDQDGP